MKGRPVLDPEFWRERLESASGAGKLHHSVFVCGADKWAEIEAAHRTILASHVGPTTSVLDVGCGYGRLIGMMPKEWTGPYLGVDLSPAFVALAQRTWGPMPFLVHDFRQPLTDRFVVGRFDLAVLVSVRPMVIRECGTDVWGRIELNVRKVADKILFLEYDPADGGSLE